MAYSGYLDPESKNILTKYSLINEQAFPATSVIGGLSPVGDLKSSTEATGKIFNAIDRFTSFGGSWPATLGGVGFWASVIDPTGVLNWPTAVRLCNYAWENPGPVNILMALVGLYNATPNLPLLFGGFPGLGKMAITGISKKAMAQGAEKELIIKAINAFRTVVGDEKVINRIKKYVFDKTSKSDPQTQKIVGEFLAILDKPKEDLYKFLDKLSEEVSKSAAETAASGAGKTTLTAGAAELAVKTVEWAQTLRSKVYNSVPKGFRTWSTESVAKYLETVKKATRISMPALTTLGAASGPESATGGASTGALRGSARERFEQNSQTVINNLNKIASSVPAQITTKEQADYTVALLDQAIEYYASQLYSVRSDIKSSKPESGTDPEVIKVTIQVFSKILDSLLSSNKQIYVQVYPAIEHLMYDVLYNYIMSNAQAYEKGITKASVLNDPQFQTFYEKYSVIGTTFSNYIQQPQQTR
jgi:hypothetical protein